MYNLFYNLKDRPFALKPDLKYFCNTRQHRRAIVHMRFGLEQPDGILVLTGEKGIGKTTLISYLLDEMDVHENIVALIQKPPQKDQDFLPTILASLQIPINEYQPKIMFNTLHDFMIRQNSQNKKIILIVDDAESLSQNCLEFIRLLSSLKQNDDGLIQIVLVGTNELEASLSDSANQPFRQQIAMSYNMHPLQLADTREYIKHRLKVAGWEDDPVIDEEAFASIHQLTGGIPYEINRYCDRLLMLGMLQERHRLENKDVAHLTAATLETLEKFESRQQQQESGEKSAYGANEISISQLPDNNNGTPHRNIEIEELERDVEKLLFDQPEKKSTAFFDKGTVLTIFVAYLISFLSIIVFDKMSEKDSANTPAVAALATSDVKVETTAKDFVTIPKESLGKEKNSDPVEPHNERRGENDIPAIELLPKKNRNPETAAEKSQPVSNVISQVLTPTVTAQELEEILGEKEKAIAIPGVKSAQKSVKQVDRELEMMLAQLDEKSPSQIEPAVLAKAETIDKQPFALKSLANVMSDIELNQVVAQFEVAYQFGDMKQIDHLFSEQILSNNIKSKKVLLEEYDKLFSITQYRKMRIFDLNWKMDTEIAIGNGSFEAAIREKGSLKKQQYKGNIILHIKKQEKGLEITELYYNYENL